MTQHLLGKPVADKIYEGIKQKMFEKNIKPKMAILQFSNSTDTISYKNSIIKKCNDLEIETMVFNINPEDDVRNVIKLITCLNSDNSVNGIMPLQPIPKWFDEVIKCFIEPSKDIDCVSITNLSNCFVGNKGITPCTPQAVIEILKHYNIDLLDKNVVVVGRSLTVGKPLSMLLLNENATVTICHSKTTRLGYYTRKADILISAIGKANYFDSMMVKDGAVIIDVGINDDGEGGICGDVDFNNVEDKVKAITPVPRGVGSVTTSILLSNLIESM